jgi:uridine phosphorylase
VLSDPPTIHLLPTAPAAARALLPGDPGRALALASALLGDDRRMFNHHRGLWGYTGTAADGHPLTIQSTGLGGPSAAIVLEELATLGVRAAIRVGTGGALAPDLAAGDLVAATEARGVDGTSRGLGAPERLALDGELAALLAAHAGTSGPVVSTDLFYPVAPDARDAWRAAGAVAVDLETAGLAAVAARHGIRLGCVLAVTPGAGTRLAGEDAERAGEAAGRGAAAALLAAGAGRG